MSASLIRGVSSAASAAFALAASSLCASAMAQCNYSVRLLEIPPHPQCPTTPAAFSGRALNNNGEVVGECLICSGSTKACWWGARSQFSVIPIAGESEGCAFAISDSGVATGGAVVGGDPSWFVWNGAATATIVTPRCDSISATGRESCNDDFLYGDVYCPGLMPENRILGVMPNGTFLDVWADISTTSAAFVQGAHEGGLLTGRLVQGRGGVDTRAFRWWNGVVELLGPVAGGITSVGFGINRWGDIVGSGQYTVVGPPRFTSIRGFAYIDGEMIDLGFLAPGDNASEATDINDIGQVVGDSFVWGSTSRAFIWQHGEMHKLRDLVADPLLGTLKSIRQINDRGDILTGASYDGVQRAIVLEPIRERAGDVDLDCKVGIHDLDLVISTWGSIYAYDHGPGDANNDHMVDAADIAYVLGDWDPPNAR